MTVNDFLKLSIAKQSEEVFDWATQIADISDEKYIYVLYSLHDFYIERRYEIKSGYLVYISAFEADCKRLDLYLLDIDLPK